MVASEQAVVTGKQLDTLCINTIRTLAIDAVQKANSGHPGAPMGLAPVAYCLWQEFLRYDPEDPKWLNRDRFVLSNGHASMLLYAMLYLAGVREVNKNGEVLKELADPDGGDQALPATWKPDSGTSRIASHHWRGDHDRAARAGRGKQRGDGDCEQMASGEFQPSGL